MGILPPKKNRSQVGGLICFVSLSVCVFQSSITVGLAWVSFFFFLLSVNQSRGEIWTMTTVAILSPPSPLFL